MSTCIILGEGESQMPLCEGVSGFVYQLLPTLLLKLISLPACLQNCDWDEHPAEAILAVTEHKKAGLLMQRSCNREITPHLRVCTIHLPFCHQIIQHRAHKPLS